MSRPASPDLAALIRRAAADDPEAQRALAVELTPFLVAEARRVLPRGPDELREDLVSQATVWALERMAPTCRTFDPLRGGPIGFLHGWARSNACRYIRDLKAGKRRGVVPVEELPEPEDAPLPSPEHQLDARRVATAFHRGLKDVDRHIFVEHLVNGRPPELLEEALGLSRGAFYKRVQILRERLTAGMEAAGLAGRVIVGLLLVVAAARIG